MAHLSRFRRVKAAGQLSRLVGFAPVPAPPHVFAVEPGAVRYACFARRGAGWECERQLAAELAADSFQNGPLGGPLRSREGFDQALKGLLEQLDPAPTEASLVLPDRWLRLLFSDLEPEIGPDPGDEILRFKLKKLVPFRVDELRLGAAVVPGFPDQDGVRLLFSFAVEQLVHDLETAFLARGVRLGQVASRSLYLISLLRAADQRGLLLVNLELDGYSFCYLAGGVPYLVRYRAASIDPGDPGQGDLVAQDLRILLAFLEQQLPGRGIELALVAGGPGAESWIQLLRDRFDLAGAVLSAQHLPVAIPDVSVAWSELAPLLAAASREVA